MHKIIQVRGNWNPTSTEGRKQRPHLCDYSM